jgi:hypothetical protein
VELYDYANGIWTNTGSLNTGRSAQTATLLPQGQVLVAGGNNAVNDGTFLSKAELYDDAMGSWTLTGTLNNARGSHTATLLPNGAVLVAGGTTSSLSATSSAELYDPATGRWALTGPMNFTRRLHRATLLLNGKVLVCGGAASGSFSSATAELYDPAMGTWVNTGNMNAARLAHTATLLPGGKVLVAGGKGSDGSSTNSAELYDPATGVWTLTGTLNTGRQYHTATLLPNGRVLVAGGMGNAGWATNAELYDPSIGTWTSTSALHNARAYHTAALLPNGKVLVTGGEPVSGGWLASTETYDPSAGTWTLNGPLNFGRTFHTATLLLSGKVLVAAGNNSAYPWFTNTSSAELYDVGLGFTNTCQPQIATCTSPLNLGGSLVLSGSGFRGVSEGSGGNSQDSPSDYPLVQLRSIESGQTMFLPSTNWQTNSFTSAPVWGYPAGYALATVFVNGIPSTGSILNISVPAPTATALTGATRLTNGACQFCFTNSPGALFGVLATTNPALPLSNWTALGGVTEIAPGQFQFTDPQASDTPRRFYRLRAP